MHKCKSTHAKHTQLTVSPSGGGRLETLLIEALLEILEQKREIHGERKDALHLHTTLHCPPTGNFLAWTYTSQNWRDYL